MREKYESLAVANLRDIAKARGIKGVSTMKKSEVVPGAKPKKKGKILTIEFK